MACEQVYLKPNALCEPLFNQWYAWAYLISPSTAALIVANSHVKLLQSFLSAPELHVAAQRNSAMRGGAFLDVDPARTAEVAALLARTRERQAPLLEFADAIRALDRILAKEAIGASLAPIYPMIPEPLRGYVELCYDLYDNPGFRFFEGLLYRSQYYDRRSQCVRLALLDSDQRPFALSTPRLEERGSLFASVPFDSDALDALYRARYTPQPVDLLVEATRTRGEDVELLRALCTSIPPRGVSPPPTGGVRIRYLGHACVLVESPGLAVLFDPAIGHALAATGDRFAMADLPPMIDYVVLTHNHQDHVMLETLLELRHRVRHVIVPHSAESRIDPSLKRILQGIGFGSVHEISDMESIAVSGGAITALPFHGEHGDLDVRTKMAVALAVHGRTVLLMADSNNLDPVLYEHVKIHIGRPDVLFIGLECDGAPMSWLYGPLLARPLTRKIDQARRLDSSDCEKAMKIVCALAPQRTYVYAMGLEPWLGHVMAVERTVESRPLAESERFVQKCRERGIESARLFGCAEMHL